MSSILLYHHLGLGDHFMCHGIVREYCKKYDRVSIFSHTHNYQTVSFMYRDLKNLTVIKGDDVFARKYIVENSLRSGNDRYDEIKLVGFENLNRTSSIPLELQFYRIAGVSLEKKWDSFYVARDTEKEQELFERVSLPNEYIFVHDDPSRNYDIKSQKINSELKVFRPNINLTENAFDYCTIIERAKEIHVIDSSFMFLIDCLDYNNPKQKLFVHRYARENNQWQLPILRKKWHILNTEISRWDFVKNILGWISNSKIFILDNPFIKRSIRKLFRLMRWSMMILKKPPLVDVIRRYTPGKSLLIVKLDGSESAINMPSKEEFGALKVAVSDIETMEIGCAYDVVVCDIDLSTKNRSSLFRKLSNLTNQILIVAVPTNFKIEPELEVTELEIQESYILRKGSLFVFRKNKV